MNISSINNTPSLPASSQTTAEPGLADVRQARVAQISDATTAQTAVAVDRPQSAETSRQQVEEAVKAVNDFLKPLNNSLQFNIDDETGKTVVKVIDSSTQEVIRQFPSEEMLTIAKAIDKMKGLLIQQKV